MGMFHATCRGDAMSSRPVSQAIPPAPPPPSPAEDEPAPSTADARLPAQVGASEHGQGMAAAATDAKGGVLEGLEIILEPHSIEKKPFASGGFGSVHRARFVVILHSLV